jgi:predicted metalloprotease
MANWGRILSRGNVEDRRGSPMAFAGGGLGLLGVGLIIVMNLLSGGSVDIGQVLGQLQGAAQQSTLTSEQFAGDDDYERFVSAVLGSNNDTWRQIFQESSKQYQEPRLVLFRTATQSGCGLSTSQVGPHYCPLDGTIYIDETFFDELQQKFGAKGGDVAEAYVVAHEVGHHVQHQLGLLNEGQRSNEDSIRTELQADCFAGIWAESVSHLNIFEPGEINEAIDAAAAVGDDRIQSKVQGQVNPETWTHGSSEQRVAWFTAGLKNGSPASCDTSTARVES